MEDNNQDFKRLRKLLGDIFGSSHSYMSYSSTGFNLMSGFDDGFPKDDDKNYNKVIAVTETDTHTTKKETWTSIDGKTTYVRTTSESKLGKEDKSKVSKEKLEELLDQAIRRQAFEEAARIRDEIKSLK